MLELGRAGGIERAGTGRYLIGEAVVTRYGPVGLVETSGEGCEFWRFHLEMAALQF